MRCPTAERLAEYVDVVRRTAGAEIMTLHVFGCQRCSSVVAAVIHGLAQDRGPADGPGRRAVGVAGTLRLVVPRRPKQRPRR